MNHFILLMLQRLQEMQTLQDQVEEAERRHSVVEGQVSFVYRTAHFFINEPDFIHCVFPTPIIM